MTVAPHAIPPPELAALEAKAQARPGEASVHVELGIALHRHGYPERALPAFETALGLAPDDVQAIAASINLLLTLQRPKAAQKLADAHRARLENSVPGCIALASSARANGDTKQARADFGRAIELDPGNVRALTALASLEMQEGEHAGAVTRLEHCLQLAPASPENWSNLVDCLIAARRNADAHGILLEAMRRFPGDVALAVRLPVLKAYLGDFTGSQAALRALPAKSHPLLAGILKAASPASAAAIRAGTGLLPNPEELFTHHAFDGMRQADWRQEKALTDVLRKLLARAEKGGQEPDWRDAQFYTLLLPLDESEQLRLRDVTAETVRQRVARAPLAETGKPPPRTDGFIHIGISVPSLLEEKNVTALVEELRLHDRGRFAFHLYSPVPARDGAAAARFEGLAEVVEIGHMSPHEAAMRIRLDRLDLWMDLTYFTPTCRIEIPAMRVAPVQVRRQNWQRMQRPPCEYGIGDTFTHPGPIGKLGSGAIARMPSTCWLGTDAELPQTTAALTRRQAGLPASGTVLCAFAQAAVLIDPLTWGCWMRILAGLPDALLWLPEFDAATRGHLLREAQAAGIGPDRLVFSPRLKRSEMLARLPLADLYLDPLRFNSPQMAADAMRAGVPAITCAGGNMASRLGGSVVTAAGMPECVVFDPASYEALAIRLGRDAAVRGAVRSRLLQAHATAPLFNTAARVREWENAWTTMVERQRAGLPAQAFDVTPANP